MTASLAPSHRKDLLQGYALGLLGVVIFGLTLPMTRLATGAADAPQLSPLFVTVGRAALAGLLSVAWLLALRARRPQRAQWPALLITAAGVVFGFPLLMALGVRQVPAVHAAVILGVLPLATAVAAALWMRQRASTAFWVWSALGSALVVLFALLSAPPGAGTGLHWADLLLLGAVACAALGYVSGARLSQSLGAQQVICWVLVLSLPLTLPATALTWPQETVRAEAWLAFGYVALFSMWLGFFAWYRALAVGGAVRISQVQLLQPFVSMLAAVPLLGERLDLMTLGFAVAVVATVFLGRRAPVQPAKAGRQA